ncbi:MAG: VOC family protein [Nocardioidaceae bacterium]
MASNLIALSFDAHDSHGLASFWAGVLGRKLVEDPDGVFVLPPTREPEFRIEFAQSDAPKRKPNQMHFELTSTSYDDQQETVQRALSLGGRHIDIGQLPEEEHVVLADPEGNEFCVIPPGNSFLANTGVIGALAGDGTQTVGYFWNKALSWPLVWDQNDETAMQSPLGGTKVSWGGPPVEAKLGKNRLHFDIAPPPDGDQPDEVDRLVSLGATRLDIGQGDVSWVVMADPDGNEFCVLTPR